jgi:hypothetical protein
MTKYRRKDLCNVCGKEVIIDDVEKTVTCGCGKYPNIRLPSKWLLEQEFEVLP